MREEFHRLIGLELSGVKTDRSTVATLDYYPKAGRLVLGHVSQKFASDMDFSADQKVLQYLLGLAQEAPQFMGLGIHGPLDLPPYLKPHNLGQTLSHPEQSEDPEVRWMNRMREKLDPIPKPFVPYLQRPAEIWLRHMTPERFPVSDGFGANGASLAARLQFLKPHLPSPLLEIYPRISVVRIGEALKIPKQILNYYTDIEEGLSCRDDILNRVLGTIPGLFIYEKDFEQLVLNLGCFHAFISALTVFLMNKGQCVPRPTDFPASAQWIYIPKRQILWEKLF